MASPAQEESAQSRDGKSLRLDLGASGTHLKRIQSANRTNGRPSGMLFLDRGTDMSAQQFEREQPDELRGKYSGCHANNTTQV